MARARDLASAKEKRVAGAKGADADVQIGGLVEQRVVSGEVRIVADPQLGGMEVAQDGGQAAHVVGVGVAQRDHVELADAARP